MSLTNPTLHVPHHRVSVPSWVRHHLSWMLVALAVLATAAVLTVMLVDSDSGTVPVAPTLIEQGSINAIDHRAAVGAGTAAGTPTLTERGSINAIDHRAAVGAGTSAGTPTLIERGSIPAVEYRVGGGTKVK